ncbi:CI-B8 domain-containing protein [Phialemonium atrogriseum]|uniref:CI-B8 domain-containing protein n=1 Tax=Phialemonium atrogriseum TaxID=1093897 RepID=A0AAJ0CAI0_9PEZI|nr:CI-B8 domain-containing protein [Phialemonium atrogriseum]KAK1772975.1 CI-B8 domain-containing protein [Phialemonium atrogriseum]
MVGVIRRMNKLRGQLLEIRHGPGAALLPPDVTRIHIEFAKKNSEGHMGPRKFWRESLPRLKFWNPAIPMIVNRTTDQAGPATMTLYFRDGSKDADAAAAAAEEGAQSEIASSADGFAKAPEPAQGERTVSINMKALHSSIILKEFMEKTGAVPVLPTPQEEAELRDAEELRKRGEVDRERVRRMLEAQRREAALVAQARNEAATLKAAS